MSEIEDIKRECEERISPVYPTQTQKKITTIIVMKHYNKARGELINATRAFWARVKKREYQEAIKTYREEQNMKRKIIKIYNQTQR